MLFYAWIAAAALAVAIVAWALAALDVLVVREYEAGLLFRRGRLVGPVTAGRYRVWTPTAELLVVDTRMSRLAIGTQEVLTRDGVPVKVSLTATYRVEDVALALIEVDSYAASLYLAAQLALRAVVGKTELEALLADRGALDAELTQTVGEKAKKIGLALDRLAIKDLMVGGDLKRAMAEVARARAEAKAKLERVRGETAALRGLQNAARLVDANGGLLKLRLLDAVEKAAEGTGNTLVLGLDAEGRSLLDTGKNGKN